MFNFVVYNSYKYSLYLYMNKVEINLEILFININIVNI